jgi:hypothetical protein
MADIWAAETHIRDRLDKLNRDDQQLRQTPITDQLLIFRYGLEAFAPDQVSRDRQSLNK